MTTKNLVVLGGVAALLGLGAYVTSSGRKLGTPALAGKSVLAPFEASELAAIDVGGKLKLVSGTNGWEIATLGGYPADVTKIREQVLKLQDLKVGQVVRGRGVGQTVLVDLQNAAGKSLACVTLGDKHVANAKGEMAMYGGYPDGRYVSFKDQTVLVKDPLEAFDGDVKSWCEAKICDKPYVSFNTIEPDAKPEVTGFATGKVCRVDAHGATNLVARVGATAANGTDRYFQIEGEKWIYTISSYTADQLVKEPEKPAEAKPAEAKPAETKPAEAKPAEAKPAEAKPAESKPAENKPAAAKPVEAKPAEAKK
ncbi:MAG: hypothetical protein MJ138_05865 [Kiritimatiellae bacterium]|nr:hypothetical protein [Kiritimatiellia bacterium]